MPTDVIVPSHGPAKHFFGGVGSNSSPEPDIWTPSPRSSPDEIDDLTARANVPLPASRSESDASRVPSRASSVDEPVNVAATPLPTPDYSSLPDDVIDGLIHPSFPDRAILDSRDKRHFLGRGDLSVTSLKLYARQIFTETTHWITAGHFLVDIFQGVTLNGSHDDFRRFVILVGTQLGYGDLAQRMSECLDVNRKMADEYMRLRDVATSWKQKAKANSKDARAGRKAQDELSKARGDITAILEEREIFIQQRREFLARDDQLSTELSRVHRDYSNAIDDNVQLSAKVETLEQNLALAGDELKNIKDSLSVAEHHRDKAERDCNDAVLRFDKAEADRKRDRAFYEARILALSSPPVPTSQPDSEEPLKKAAIERSTLLSKIDNLKKELTVRDTELAKLRAEVSLSEDVNVLRAELAEAKAVAARLSGMYEQKSKDFRDSELERLALLGKQILADGNAPKETPPARPRPVSRRGRQRSRSAGRATTDANAQDPSPPVSSQPFWQDEPLFTKHVAAVTTATMSALPHLPFETAIANAVTTVRNVGPPPPLKLDKKPGNRRSSAPSPPTPAPAPQGNFTFADIAKAAAGKNDEGNKKKPTWRAIETNKSLVLRPSTKGTRGAMRPCRRWVDKQIHPMCLQCLIWGHGNYNCTSNILRCKKCGENHDYPNHEKFCETCQHGAGKVCVPKCYNCQGNHFADSRDCVFYKHRTSREDLANLYKQYHPSPASIQKNEEARKRNAPPKGWLKQQMYDIHRMGKDDEEDDGFTKVSKGTKRPGVRFPASAEVPSARIDVLPEEEEDTPVPLASDPLHRLERDTYGSRTPGAPVGRSMGGDANRRLGPADSKDGKYIANISPPTPQNVPLAPILSPEL
ncbi:hypothetical protein AX14_004949 [Amanita brunnescens Koide BX004]|nr:hypothetical protein AX14_004949 [Amanita brunnescens Koide BX004]